MSTDWSTWGSLWAVIQLHKVLPLIHTEYASTWQRQSFLKSHVHRNVLGCKVTSSCSARAQMITKITNFDKSAVNYVAINLSFEILIIVRVTQIMCIIKGRETKKLLGIIIFFLFCRVSFHKWNDPVSVSSATTTITSADEDDDIDMFVGKVIELRRARGQAGIRSSKVFIIQWLDTGQTLRWTITVIVYIEPSGRWDVYEREHRLINNSSIIVRDEVAGDLS